MTNTEISERSRGITLVMAGLLGWVGAHRFYTGKTATGVAMALTLGGLGIWWFYDVILIALGGFRDAEERRVTRWWEGEDVPGARASLTSGQVELILEELDALRGDMGDLSERVDFMERVLAQVKERGALPPPNA